MSKLMAVTLSIYNTDKALFLSSIITSGVFNNLVVIVELDWKLIKVTHEHNTGIKVSCLYFLDTSIF